MSTQSRYSGLSGIIAYLVVWLVILPVVAEASVHLAVLGLAFLTGLYCFLMARWKHRNEALWTLLGVLAGFVEVGLIPVAVISVLSFKYVAANDPNLESISRTT